MLGVLVLSQTARAHSNILYDIDLSFDPELNRKIISSAQSHLNTTEEPLQFDFNKELIAVKFNRTLEYSVLINPLDYSLHGFRDDSLIKAKETINYNGEERKGMAQKIFDNLPEEYKSELVYGGEEKLYSGAFKHIWHRYINGTYVSGEHLEVEVDGTNGEVIAWKLSIFLYPKTQIKTIPAITFHVAQKIAEISFNAKPIDFKPVLVIEKNKPVWIVKVKGIYSFFVAVDAMDGKVLYSGSFQGELPENYDYGRDVEVIETGLIRSIYKN